MDILKKQTGSALIEMAIVLPIFIFLIIAVIDFGVSYNTDLVKFPKLMDKFIKSIDGQYDYIIEKPQFLGVVKLDNSSINMRVIAKTVAVKHFQIERDIRSDLVIFCSSNNIEIPFPQLVIHNE